MAEDKKTTEVNSPKKTDPSKELVTARFIKDSGKYKNDITVVINGKAYKIQRGVEVKIPRCVYDVIVDSMNADAETAMLIDKLSSEAITE